MTFTASQIKQAVCIQATQAACLPAFSGHLLVPFRTLEEKDDKQALLFRGFLFLD